MNLYVKKLTLLVLILHFVTNITVQAMQPLALRPLPAPTIPGNAFLDSLRPLIPLSDDDNHFLATHKQFMQKQAEKRNQIYSYNDQVVEAGKEEQQKLAQSLVAASQQLERGMAITEQTLEQMQQRFMAFLTAIRTKYDELFAQGEIYCQRYQNNKEKIDKLKKVEAELLTSIKAYQEELQLTQVKDAARAFANFGQLEVKIQEQVQIFNQLVTQTPK